MNKLELLKLIQAAPKNLTEFQELLSYARNIYKQVMGVFPEGIDNIAIKNAAKNIANQRDPNKVVQFPGGSKIKQPQGAKMDVQRAHENLSGGANYAKGDTKYNADILANEIAMQRGIIKNLDDADLIDTELKTELYGEAYDYLTKLNMLNNPSAIKPRPPGKGKFGITTLDDAGNPIETKTTTPEGIMKTLMGGGKTKKGELFNISGQKGKFLTEDEFARELESANMNFIQNSPGFNLSLISDLKKPGSKAYNPFPKEQGDRFLTDNQRQRVLSSLEKIMKNKQYQERFADNFADLMQEGEDVIEFAPDLFKIDPPKKADGGRIGFSGGGAGFAGDPMQGDQYVMGQQIPGSPQVPMGQFGLANIGIFGGGGYSKNEIVPGVDVATTDQNLGITGQIPIGNTGFTLGGSYMKSRANERFTGTRIPNQVFKNVPVDSDKFNVGINFTKRFKDGGRIGFKDGTPKDPSRRGFIKLMAGLASLPIVGKLFRPAAKVADKAAPVIQEGAKLGYENFMLLVDKIKRFGKPADNLATKEREKVTRYVSDNNEYELIEDLSSGDIRIVKDRIGGSTYGDEAFEVINDRSVLDYKSPKSFYNNETKKSGKTVAEYDEVKEVANRDGTFDDFDEIDDFAVQEMLEEIGKTPIKKAGGGLAYMLGE